MQYKSYRIVYNKAKWVIVDNDGNILDKNPKKEELKNYKEYISQEKHKKYSRERAIKLIRLFYEDNRIIPMFSDFNNNPRYPSGTTIVRIFGNWNNAIKDAGLWEKRYNTTNTCDRCGVNFNELTRTPTKEYDINGKWIEKWDCPKCWIRNDPNSPNNVQKTLRNINPNINAGILPSELFCYICNKKAESRERDDKGIWTGKFVCKKHYHIQYSKYYYKTLQSDILKSLTHIRTGNQDPNSSRAKGDKGEDLLCEWKGYTNLNKKLDNYNTRRDCLDEKTGEYYQVKTRYYNSIEMCWKQGFASIRSSVRQGFGFKSLFFFCISKDGKIVERIYEIPEKEVLDHGAIGVVGNPTDSHGNPIIPWHEKYRVIDKLILKRVNEIWKKILEEDK